MDIRDLPEELWFAVRSGKMWSRKVWVWVGDAAQWLATVGGFWYLSQDGVSLAACGVVLVACILGQAGAVAAVVWPGASADTHELADYHQSVTVAILCLTFIFGFTPAGIIVGRNHDDSSVAALLVTLVAFLLTSIAGLVAVTELSGRTVPGNGRELPEEPDLIDVGDSGSGSGDD